MRSLVKIWRVLPVAAAMLCLIALTGARVRAREESAQQEQEHLLRLYNTHTGERLEIVFRRGEQYILGRLRSWIISCATIIPATFGISIRDYTIFSPISLRRWGAPMVRLTSCGYRTPSTNESLRAHTTGVAKNSLHIQAEAIDLRMPGVDTLTLRRAALALRRGGVGYYPHSDFIHVDTGRVRQWCFDCPARLITGD